MKLSFLSLPHVTFLSVLATLASTRGATTVAPGDPGAIPGVNTFVYDNYYVMGNDHTATWIADTDAYSWNHPNLGNGLTGWTHLSRWVALTTTTAVDLTIRLEQAGGVMIPDNNNPGNFVEAGGDLVPAFTIWSGLMPDVVASGGHQWDNDGDGTPWMQGHLTYVASEGNFGNAPFIEVTLSLPAGDYTLNFAGSKDGAFDPGVVPGDLRKGYEATFTTVPEPSALLLSLVTLVGFLGRRRRPIQR